MPEKQYRTGFVAVPRTPGGEILLLPVQPEDVNGKNKHERVVWPGLSPQEYEKILPGQLGLLSGAIKRPEDWKNGIHGILPAALTREALAELNLEILPEAIGQNPKILGTIEQQRNGDEISFLVFILEVAIAEQQLAFLDDKVKKIRAELHLPPEDKTGLVTIWPRDAAKYLRANSALLRPAARLALKEYANNPNLKL